MLTNIFLIIIFVCVIILGFITIFGCISEWKEDNRLKKIKKNNRKWKKATKGWFKG